ncbi:MAG TPA: DUF2911 domain-containing protein [Vicinamibacteria bacterium]|nr:DUF2911 domain-containing protein [Vicinamibacteria bacterium]
MKTRIGLVAAVLALPALAAAQAAPRENPSVSVGGKKVSIEYGRPSLKGRAIKDLLAQLPADRVWRTGVDQVTTLTTEGDILVGGKKIAAGKYSVYVHAPENGEWSLLLNSDPGVPLKTIYAGAPPAVADALWPRLDGYDKVKDKEVARATLKSGKSSAAAEQLLITLAPAGNGATVTLAWGDQTWTTDIKPAK